MEDPTSKEGTAAIAKQGTIVMKRFAVSVNNYYMCVCVCVCVCMYICMYACMHACTHARTHARAYVRTYVCMYLSVSFHIYDIVNGETFSCHHLVFCLKPEVGLKLNFVFL